jgi:hypothetical protein
VWALPIQCLFTPYALPIHCLSTAYPLPIHSQNTYCLFTAVYPLPIHCLFTAYPLPIHCQNTTFIHCLFTAYSLLIHCLFTAYSLPIHCLFTDYSLPIHWLFTAYSLPVHTAVQEEVVASVDVFALVRKRENPLLYIHKGSIPLLLPQWPSIDSIDPLLTLYALYWLSIGSLLVVQYTTTKGIRPFFCGKGTRSRLVDHIICKFLASCSYGDVVFILHSF